MTDKTAAQRARVKPGTTIAILNPAPNVVESLGLPEDVAFVEPKEAQLVFLFVQSRAELETKMPEAVADLGKDSAIWVFLQGFAKRWSRHEPRLRLGYR